MKIVIAGGTGQVGVILTRAFRAKGHEVVIIGRRNGIAADVVQWDGKTLGEWAGDIDGSDVVINLAGRSVNCRYTDSNLNEMMRSRVDSTRVIGQAIHRAEKPPKVWLQMSTATIYSHRYSPNNDEADGEIGGNELGAPKYWRTSIDIAKAWENAQAVADTPRTRKIAMRTAMVMSPDGGGIFDVLLGLVRWGLGGPVGGGGQFVSWIYDRDFIRAVEFLIERDDLSGAINMSAPQPLPQREFMEAIREAWGIRLGLPATKWMAEIGAVFMRTDTELIFKSRRVVPGRLLDAGFKFKYREWPAAASELVARWREQRIKGKAQGRRSASRV